MKYLIAIDSDGTLRHSDGTISERTKKIVKELINRNNTIVICTARPRYHTEKISQELGASNYLISSNGAEVYDNKLNKLIWAMYLYSDDCIKLYNYSKENNLRIMFVLDDKEYVTQFVRNNNQTLLNDDNISEVLNAKIKQAMIIGNEKDKINKFKDIVINEYHMNVVDSSNQLKEGIWFSVVSRDSSKGIALMKLAEYLNVSIENTIAIGNDSNDISMFKVVNKSVAVDNATKEAKANAKETIESNDDDGVAIYLEEFLKNI